MANDGTWQLEGSRANVIHKGDEAFLFGIRQVKLEQLTIQASQETDLYISLQGNKLEAWLLGDSKTTLTFKKGKKRNKNMTTVELVPGEHSFVDLD